MKGPWSYVLPRIWSITLPQKSDSTKHDYTKNMKTRRDKRQLRKIYSKTCLKQTSAGPNNLSALDRCPLLEVYLFWLSINKIRLKYALFLYMIMLTNKKRLEDQKLKAPSYRNCSFLKKRLFRSIHWKWLWI